MTQTTDKANLFRLNRSLQSATCPLCGRRKPERQALCIPCNGELPAPLAAGFVASSLRDGSFERAMHAVFAWAHAGVFVDPPPREKCQRFGTAVEVFTIDRLTRSLASILCPVCGQRKQANHRMCESCGRVLRLQLRADGDFDDNRLDVELAMMRAAVTFPQARIDPETAAVTWQRIFELIGADVFYVPME